MPDALTLFDQLGSEPIGHPAPAAPPEPSAAVSAAPDPVPSGPEQSAVSGDVPERPRMPGEGRLTPIEYLCRTLEAEHRMTTVYEVHPRDDKLWVVREGARYGLSLWKGRRQFAFSAEGIRQFAALVDVGAGLLRRLAARPKIEDCRLLNMLLWDESVRPDMRIKLLVRGDEIVAVHTGAFTALEPLAVARGLAEAEAQGRLRVRRYDLTAGALWVEVEHPALRPLDLSPGMDRATTKADLWRPGALLVHHVDGGHAVAVVPALLREWGGLALPVIPGRADIRKRRHVHTTAEALLRATLGDIAATQSTDFAEAAERLRQFHQRFLPTAGVHAYLEGLAFPFPSGQHRDSVVRQATTGRATVYRLLAATLKETREVGDFARRLKLALAVGRHVWTRSGSRRGAQPRETSPSPSPARPAARHGSATPPSPRSSSR